MVLGSKLISQNVALISWLWLLEAHWQKHTVWTQIFWVQTWLILLIDLMIWKQWFSIHASVSPEAILGSDMSPSKHYVGLSDSMCWVPTRSTCQSEVSAYAHCFQLRAKCGQKHEFWNWTFSVEFRPSYSQSSELVLAPYTCWASVFLWKTENISNYCSKTLTCLSWIQKN
jgi:hypothetical protein